MLIIGKENIEIIILSFNIIPLCHWKNIYELKLEIESKIEYN